MKHDLIKKITLSGILLGIIIGVQFLKNIDAAVPVSGSIINTCLVLATINVSIWVGIGFSVVVPCLSLLIAPASGTSIIANATYGVSVIIIALANIIFVLIALFGYRLFKKLREHKYCFVILAVALAFAALAKWLFMWGSAAWIIEPVFKNRMDEKQLKILGKIFSITQLIAASIAVPIVYLTQLTLERFYHRS